MEKFDRLPKSVKKTIRYINQDASSEELRRIEQLISLAIQQRKKKFFNRQVNIR
ncbi:hypothetical protein ACBZ92_06320 [Priestia aryabhattai]|uniref:hypothetical protein n=1 Tax=Priestia aryabhattai TaxID=412384 RepID=UPI00356484FA